MLIESRKTNVLGPKGNRYVRTVCVACPGLSSLRVKKKRQKLINDNVVFA